MPRDSRGCRRGARSSRCRIVLYAQGEAETGRPARNRTGGTTSTEQFGIRYGRSERFIIDAGRITPVIGTFSTRHFSTRNPLIGSPMDTRLQYPLGVKVSGETSALRLSSRDGVAAGDHIGYVPTANGRVCVPRSASVFTPIVGPRIGARSPSARISTFDLARRSSRETVERRITSVSSALDVAFSRGYLETHAEAARGTLRRSGARDGCERVHVLRRSEVHAFAALLRRRARRAQQVSVHSADVDHVGRESHGFRRWRGRRRCPADHEDVLQGFVLGRTGGGCALGGWFSRARRACDRDSAVASLRRDDGSGWRETRSTAD